MYITQEICTAENEKFRFFLIKFRSNSINFNFLVAVYDVINGATSSHIMYLLCYVFTTATRLPTPTNLVGNP